jgi:hypothetical protein
MGSFRNIAEKSNTNMGEVNKPAPASAIGNSGIAVK